MKGGAVFFKAVHVQSEFAETEKWVNTDQNTSGGAVTGDKHRKEKVPWSHQRAPDTTKAGK